MKKKQSQEKKDEGSNEQYLSSRELLQILDVIYRDKKLSIPRGTNAPRFSFEESRAIFNLIFFKPKNIVLKVYERIPNRYGLTFKRRLFIEKLLGDARLNAAKAARMAGYSSKSAKQIAYNLMRKA